MKILFNCTSSISGGGRAYLKNLAALLMNKFQSGGQHELLFLAYQDQEELLVGVAKSSVIWIPGAKPDRFRRIVWERHNLAWIVTKHHFDVVFTPSQVAQHINNVKNVLMIRNMEPFFFRNYKYGTSTWLRNMILSNISARHLRSADRVIAVSRFAANYLSEIDVSKEKIRIIYHGSPASQLLTSIAPGRIESIGIKDKFILTSGSMLPYRRYEDVIRSFNLCLPAIPESMMLVIAGSGMDTGYAKMIQEVIAKSPKPSRILVLGNVSWDTMIELYHRCEIFVMSTEIEACPNIALEAMASGCLIIASNRPPLPEILDDCALSYQARDVDSLSQKILNGLREKALSNEFRSKAIQRARHFSWDTCVEKTYSALTDW